jgi:hypothetical protein
MRVSAAVLGMAVRDYVRGLPLTRVVRVHVSEPRMRGGHLVDAHEPLQAIEYELLDFVLTRTRPRVRHSPCLPKQTPLTRGYCAMFRLWKCLMACILIVSVTSLVAGCSLSPARFVVRPDENDFIEYAFGGGELGAPWTQMTIRGDGRITYHYVFPNAGTWPREEMIREHSLSPSETQRLFQALVDAGLFGLIDLRSESVGISRTTIAASIDGHELKVSIEGTPDERIHGEIRALVEEIRLEWIIKVAIHVNLSDGYAYCVFNPDGWAEGGHESGGFVHMEKEEIPGEEIAAIWEVASELNPAKYPLEVSAIRDCVDCVDLFIYYEDGQVMRISWPFGEEHADPTVRALAELIYEYNIGGW